MATEAKEVLDYEAAVAMLPDGDDIHTFRSAGFALIGADWRRADILDAIRENVCELAGPGATGMKHGLVVHVGGSPLFVATK